MITTILFDLDGTLLPMDNDVFTKYYFRLLCKKLAPFGYQPQELIDAVWTGTAAMVQNDGSQTNEEVFWKRFAEVLGDRVRESYPVFEEFYEKEFSEAKAVCGYDPELVRLVHDLKAKGYRLALATNPIFPAVATRNRIRWAGLEPEDFDLVTTYESIGLCKPNPAYYAEILNRLGVKPEECMMIGNDATEDTAAEKIGVAVYLLTDNLLNKQNLDISRWPNGGADGIRKLLL